MRAREHDIINSLVKRIGGRTSVETIVTDVLKKLSSNRKFDARLKGVDTTDLTVQASAFLCQAFGDQHRYEGRSVFEIFKPMHIGETEWGEVETYFFDALSTLEGDPTTIFHSIIEVKIMIARLRSDIISSLLVRVKGKPGVVSLVDKFYDSILEEKRFKSVFSGVNSKILKSRLVAFLASAFGGKDAFDEIATIALFKPLKLKHADFNVIVEYLAQSLKAGGFSDRIVEDALEASKPLRGLMTNALFDRLHGAGTVDATIDTLYQKISGDESLKKCFKDVDVDLLKARHRMFFHAAMGANVESEDDVGFKTSYKELNLKENDFRAITTHLQAALEELGIDPELIDDVLKIQGDIKDEVAPRKSSKRASVEKEEYQETPLHIAAQEGDAASCRELLKGGANASCKDDSWGTPLHRAARLGRVEAVKILLEFKADPNAITKATKQTPLHRGAFSNNPETIKALLSAMADPNLESTGGETALKVAIKYKKDVAAQLLSQASR
eukprot:GEMP01016188.1.p1 GENE.GEMP01016188.1~~GEMP01016188.1.p1  ORF type:complete len:500 (+),score=99.59 GEMP01016188.1:789-2288(+)